MIKQYRNNFSRDPANPAIASALRMHVRTIFNMTLNAMNKEFFFRNACTQTQLHSAGEA